MQTRDRTEVSTLLSLAARLGFGSGDRADLAGAAAGFLADPANRVELARRIDRLRAGIGDLAVSGEDPWVDLPEGRGDGLLPMLALLATAKEVVDHLIGRGVPESQAWCNLSDLGQQVRVHRLTYGRFGLHTYGWLRIAWAGGFAWLGRLQFNLQSLRSGEEWVLSTHIPRRGADQDGPRSGALAARVVDDSFARAVPYFRRHYPELSTKDFWCLSWLLDPNLAAALPGSNIAGFQRRWEPDDDVAPGDDDAIFFTFSRRPPVDLDALPRSTRLERVVLDRLAAGGHWTLRSGRIRHDSIGPR